MPLKVECPQCSKVVRCADASFGKRGRCPKCKTVFRIGQDNSTRFEDKSTNESSASSPSSPVFEPDDVKPKAAIERKPSIYRDQYVTIWLDGSSEFRIESVDEAKLAIKSLQLAKKQFRLHLKDVNLQMRDRRHEYTDNVRNRLPKFPGGGKFGQFIRLIQTIDSTTTRMQLANDIDPLHRLRQRIDEAILILDRHIIHLEGWVLKLKKG
jgi:phage FluMu protein Com